MLYEFEKINRAFSINERFGTDVQVHIILLISLQADFAIFKEMTQLTKQKEQLDARQGINPFNGKSRAAEISKVLGSYIPNVARMQNQLNKYGVAFTKTTAENKKLRKQSKTFSDSLQAGAS